jgi:FkbM family methyltransferase
MPTQDSAFPLRECHLLMQRGVADADRGDAVAAAAVLRRGLRAYPDDPYVLHYAGVIESRIGAPAEAAALLARAVERNGGLFSSEMELGDLSRRLGDARAALHWYRRAGVSDPTSAFPHLRAAEVERGLGDAEAALRSLRRARALDPDSAAVTAEMAAVLLQLGRYADLHLILATLAPDSDALAGFATGLAPSAAASGEPSAERAELLAALRARQASGEPGPVAAPESGPASLALEAEIRFEGKSVTSLIANKLDIIQWHHLKGGFYEMNQLLFHRNMIPHGSTVLDVGANVGNHTMFYATWTQAARIYCFEPNPTARAILLRNLRANHLEQRVDTRHVEHAVGHQDMVAFINPDPLNNLGATSLSLVPSEPETARRASCRRLDGLAFEGPIAFLKIDVEGWDLLVLAGGLELIRTHKPTISIEIGDAHARAFWDWTEAHRYHVINAFADTVGGQTYVMVPRF